MQHFPYKSRQISQELIFVSVSFIYTWKENFIGFSHYVHCVQVLILLSKHFSERNKKIQFFRISFVLYFHISIFHYFFAHTIMTTLGTAYQIIYFDCCNYIHVQLIEKILSNHIIMNWCDKHLYFSFRYLLYP